MANLNATPSISIKEYEEALSQLAARREPHVFYNEGNEHALVVFKTIFKNAKKSLYIVAKDLTNTEVSNASEYIDSLSNFLNREDTKLNIMLTSVDNNIVRNTQVFRSIFNSNAYKRGNVNIFNLNGKKFKDGDNIVHFCFADGQMYRIETDIENRKARGNFNDSSVAEGLLKSFQTGEKLETTTKVNLSEIFI